MIIKEKFELLKNVPNVLNVSSRYINSRLIDNGPRKAFVQLEMSRIQHFAYKRTKRIITNLKQREMFQFIYDPEYVLPAAYNVPTKTIIINLSPFGADDITNQYPGERNLFACLVYGICLYDLILKKVSIKPSYASNIVAFLNSIFIRWFGKEYGLLGRYSTEIPKLKFLISLYILASFFGIIGTKAEEISATGAGVNYDNIKDDLKKYDFTKIEMFIKSLSDFKVMPGMNKYIFTSKVLRFASVNFIPVLEDLSRFIAGMTVSSISGSSLVPTYLSKWNEVEFNNILTISKNIF